MPAHYDTSRALLSVGGEERITFLQGILTQDVTQLDDTRGLFAALLSPQGKITHDMFLIPHGQTVLIDCAAAQKDQLLARLMMYKLRAKVTFTDVTDQWRVALRIRAEHATIGHVTRKKHHIVMTDPRAAELGERLYLEPSAPAPAKTASYDEYHAHRIALGIPDSQFDIADDVAMDAGYDLLAAISFSKGCYVGQEVTARMHYKNIARRGFYIVESTQPLPPTGTVMKAGSTGIGTLRGSMGTRGLAMLKFEEVDAAETTGAAFAVDNVNVQLTAPAWLHPKLAQFRATRENQ